MFGFLASRNASKCRKHSKKQVNVQEASMFLSCDVLPHLSESWKPSVETGREPILNNSCQSFNFYRILWHLERGLIFCILLRNEQKITICKFKIQGEMIPLVQKYKNIPKIGGILQPLYLQTGVFSFHRKSPPWLCFSTCQGESLTKQWTYGPT